MSCDACIIGGGNVSVCSKKCWRVSSLILIGLFIAPEVYEGKNIKIDEWRESTASYLMLLYGREITELAEDQEEPQADMWSRMTSHLQRRY